ncbi:hypothetical protein MPDQ_007892 [Monascus purpureus]|uniref:Pre-rRNA processing protein n=1 Tax=Monascus purpureus TaxID=5098 RepID=A0A507R535_MONPU|nr:hypothetical protein MPDQ_007892 [Monascus purpureus]BDD62912.1 hypothetical protein MAP00_007865 [Monascus purpureus]
MASTTPAPTQQPSQQPTEEEKQKHLDLGIIMALHTWPALSLAVSSNWGGPASSDKRDWLCGAISDMLQDRPETDAEDLEDVLIQVMSDEFDVVIDDESAAGVAMMIMRMREQVKRGEFGEINEMWVDWETKRKNKGKDDTAAMFKKVEGNDADQETSDEEDNEDDVEMGEAPELVAAPRERVEPEIDEDGFTKVVGRRKR